MGGCGLVLWSKLPYLVKEQIVQYVDKHWINKTRRKMKAPLHQLVNFMQHVKAELDIQVNHPGKKEEDPSLPNYGEWYWFDRRPSTYGVFAPYKTPIQKLEEEDLRKRKDRFRHEKRHFPLTA